MTLTRKWIPSPNYSSRGGANVRLIVVHTAEGALTIEALGNFFKSSSAGVSSHTGADDKKNTIGEYVKRGNKAWTAANANPYAVQIELCAFAKWSRDEWMRHPNMLANCAAWIKEEAAKFEIPIVRFWKRCLSTRKPWLMGWRTLGLWYWFSHGSCSRYGKRWWRRRNGIS